MSKFKFSEKERHELAVKLGGIRSMQDRIDCIEQIVSEREQSEPAETGGAEQEMKDADTVLMQYHLHHEDELGITWLSAIKAMTTYAAKRCAEKDREIKLLSNHKILLVAEIDGLEYKLKDVSNLFTEANKRIEYIDSHRSRLIESVKKWGGAWRKCRAELKEVRRLTPERIKIVVPSERKAPTDADMLELGMEYGWNDCIKEIKNLNSIE